MHINTYAAAGTNELSSEVVHPQATDFQSSVQVTVKGKFFDQGGNVLYIKGVTYGTFEFNEHGEQYPSPERVCHDFSLMVKHGINSVRVYTVPPRWLLDTALQFGIHVMVGIPWEQHIAVLDDPDCVRDIQRRFTESVKQCNSHPAIFCFSIGNEIPVSVVRWCGRKRIQTFLKSLYEIVKAESPNILVTYVNFPTTEFLTLDFIDFYSFNVYLEQQEDLVSYLPRLHTLAGDKPLLLGEVGLDTQRNGETKQSESLRWQLSSLFEFGAAGSFVFAWTDEWFTGGNLIEDWSFGITAADRTPKAALATVSHIYNNLPVARTIDWPSFTVVVCSYNGASTIERTLQRLAVLDYPNYEVIVVDDGSTDNTAKIASRYPVKLISTENFGLSSARNTGYRAGTGTLVAYIDDDAFPETHWLTHLALAFHHHDVVAVGGPNLPVPGDVMVADCVANAPGGPMEVLISDTIAEHIPGCNMCFKRSALDQIDGFDPQFRAAGDDVDLCWRIQEQVGTIGFQPSAFNWHHRRDTVKGYWKQQCGYGLAESLLAKKWPLKYNSVGHVSWHGKLYGSGVTRQIFGGRNRIYQGVWGSAPFQRLYQNTTPNIFSITVMPEWMVVVAFFALLALVGLVWSPMQWAVVPFVASAGIWLWQAVRTSLSGKYQVKRSSGAAYIKRVVVTTWLAMIYPLARLSGRIKGGLTPLRVAGNAGKSSGVNLPLVKRADYWDGDVSDSFQRLTLVKKFINQLDIGVRTGGDYDPWDLEVRGGIAGGARLSLMVEHHGEQLSRIRYRVVQRFNGIWIFAAAIMLFYSMFLVLTSSPVAGILTLGFLALLIYKGINDSGHAATVLTRAVSHKEVAKAAPVAHDSDISCIQEESESVAA